MPTTSFFPLPLSPRHPLLHICSRSSSRSVSPSAPSFRRDSTSPATRRMGSSSSSRASSCEGFLSARSCATEGVPSRQPSPAPGESTLAPASSRPPALLAPTAATTSVDRVNSFLATVMTQQKRAARTTCGADPPRHPRSAHCITKAASPFDALLLWLAGREVAGRRALENAERRCWDSVSCHWRLSRCQGSAAGKATLANARGTPCGTVDETMPFEDCRTPKDGWGVGVAVSPPSLVSSSSRRSVNGASLTPPATPLLLPSPVRAHGSDGGDRADSWEPFFDDPCLQRLKATTGVSCGLTERSPGLQRAAVEASALLSVAARSSSPDRDGSWQGEERAHHSPSPRRASVRL